MGNKELLEIVKHISCTGTCTGLRCSVCPDLCCECNSSCDRSVVDPELKAEAHKWLAKNRPSETLLKDRIEVEGDVVTIYRKGLITVLSKDVYDWIKSKESTDE